MSQSSSVIWLSDTNRHSGWTVVLEDDDRSCWLYLREQPNGEVRTSVFAYSPIPPVSRADFKKMVRRGDTPILMADYAAPVAVIRERCPADFSFRWRDDGRAAAVLFRGEVIAVISEQEKYGSSRALARPGPFGEPLDLSRYEWLRKKDSPTRRYRQPGLRAQKSEMTTAFESNRPGV